jgi:hypothetical protein
MKTVGSLGVLKYLEMADVFILVIIIVLGEGENTWHQLVL